MIIGEPRPSLRRIPFVKRADMAGRRQWSSSSTGTVTLILEAVRRCQLAIILLLDVLSDPENSRLTRG